MISTECNLAYCRLSECNGYYCTRCKDGYYLDTTRESSLHYCTPCPSACSGCEGYEGCSECQTGHYGNLCQLNCSERCKDSICDKNSTSCTNGCIDGYYQETNGSCSQCILINCRPTECHGNNCTRCKDGYYLDTSLVSWRHYCHGCPLSCSRCDGYEDCSQCKTGHYGNQCRLKCTDGCKDNICDKDSGSCLNGCIDGYYQETDGSCSACILTECRPTECHGNNCTRCNDGYYLDTTSDSTRHWCKPCPSTCASCDGFEDCSLCNTGHFGYRCKLNCADICKDNICDKNSSSCINGCIDSYYQETDSTCSKCPYSCSHCSSSVSCSECKNVTSWGSVCQHTCDHCSSCSKTDGCSSSCDNGYYRKYNSNKGGYECIQCPGACTSCSAVDNCQSCITD